MCIVTSMCAYHEAMLCYYMKNSISIYNAVVMDGVSNWHIGYPHTSGIPTHRVSPHIGYPHTSGIPTHRVSPHIGYPHTSGIPTHRVSPHIGYPHTLGMFTHWVSPHIGYPHTLGMFTHWVCSHIGYVHTYCTFAFAEVVFQPTWKWPSRLPQEQCETRFVGIHRVPSPCASCAFPLCIMCLPPVHHVTSPCASCDFPLCIM